MKQSGYGTGRSGARRRSPRRSLRVATVLATAILAGGLVLVVGPTAFGGSGYSTTTSVSSSSNPSILGQNVTFVATIEASFYTSSFPGGTVTFYDDGTELGTRDVGVHFESGNTAVPEAILNTKSLTNSLPAGTNNITAVYSGATGYAGSTSAAYEQIVLEQTSLTLTASPSSSVEGSSVALTAVVTGSTGGVLPNGLVNFSFDGKTLAQLQLTDTEVNGVKVSDAVDPISGLPVGTDSITATYLGSDTFAVSKGSATEVVQAPAPPSAPRQLSATVTPGGEVMLGWLAPSESGTSPLEGYSVFAGTSPGGESAVPVNPTLLGPTTTSYSVQGLSAGETYYFTVVAMTSVGASPPSNEVSATIPSPKFPPP